MELYSPYKNDDGVVKRLTIYKNLNYTEKVCCWQWYQNRDDSLETIEKNFQTNQIIENYVNGRTDSLKCNKNHNIMPHLNGLIPRTNMELFFIVLFFLSYLGFTRSMERDGEKMLEYYEKSRLDGLLKLEVGQEYVREYYEQRKNRYNFITQLHEIITNLKIIFIKS